MGKQSNQGTGDRLRSVDYFLLAWFSICAVICAVIDVEQVIIKDPSNFQWEDVPWPPKPVVQLLHWWGRECDPALLARSSEFQYLIWIDLFYYLPFYFVAIYAVIFGKRWLREHLLVQSASIITGTSTIIFVNLMGEHPSPNPVMLLSAYLPYILVPLFLIYYCLTHKDLFQGRPNPLAKTKSS